MSTNKPRYTPADDALILSGQSWREILPLMSGPPRTKAGVEARRAWLMKLRRELAAAESHTNGARGRFARPVWFVNEPPVERMARGAR